MGAPAGQRADQRLEDMVGNARDPRRCSEFTGHSPRGHGLECSRSQTVFRAHWRFASGRGEVRSSQDPARRIVVVGVGLWRRRKEQLLLLALLLLALLLRSLDPAVNVRRCGAWDGVAALGEVALSGALSAPLPGRAGYLRTQRSSQARTSSCQSLEFCGFRTQWFSSGKWRNRLGTPLRCSAVNVEMPWVSTTR